MVSRRAVDEEVSYAISRYLSQWKLNIARKLRCTDDEVESIDAKAEVAEVKRISFLKAWKQKFAMKATYRALIESLLEGGGCQVCV